MASQNELPVDLLREILSELKTLNETISLFTNDGLPLNRQVPTAETMAGIMAACALLSKHDARMTPADADERIRIGQPLGARIIQQSDAYQEQTQRARLEGMAR